MLTADQLKQRCHGLGGSELAAVLGRDRWKSALDIWSGKFRGPSGDIPPLHLPPADLDTPGAFEPIVSAEPTVAGQIIEDGIVRLYEHRTGARTRRVGTRRHKRHRWAIVTPDRAVDLAEDIGPRVYGRGLECKLVGHYMADEWSVDEPSERAWIQCQWGMAITELPRWDIAALINGTQFRVYRIVRDDGFIRDAFEVAEDWWHTHVIGNVPPEPRDAADLARFTRKRFPGDNGEAVEIDADHPGAALIEELGHLMIDEKDTTRKIAECKAKLEALTGENRSLLWDGVGRFAFVTMNGAVAWKKLAEHLHGGPVEDALADQFRGEAFRKSQLYKFKAKGTKAA